jgi:hypothetical protein
MHCGGGPAGGDGRWGTVAKTRGGGEGPIRGGRGIDRGSPEAVHGGVARWGEAGDGGVDRWSLVVLEGSVTGYASERSSWRHNRGTLNARMVYYTLNGSDTSCDIPPLCNDGQP